MGRGVDVTLHIDGFESLAKGDTHQRRHLKREGALGNIKSNMRILERKRGRWLSSKVTNKIDKSLRTACQLYPDARDALAANLQDLGYNVCLCRAETDPCIATHCSTHTGYGESAVLSIDSDYLFYSGVNTLLRPNPKGPGLLCYKRADVKKALRLVHDVELVLYGCVNNNDYNRNIPTIGLIRSLEMIRPSTNEDDEAGSASEVSQESGSEEGDTDSSSSEDERPTKRAKASAEARASQSQVSPSITSPADMDHELTLSLGLREILQQFCEKATAAIKKEVSPSFFESSIRTFGFLSQLKKGESPISHPEHIPLWKPSLVERTATSLPPLSFPPLPEPQLSENALMEQVQLQLERYSEARAERTRFQEDVSDLGPTR